MSRFFPDGTFGSASWFSVIAFCDKKPAAVASCARMGKTCTPEVDVRPEGSRHAHIKRLVAGKAAAGPPERAGRSVGAASSSSGFLGVPFAEAAPPAH